MRANHVRRRLAAGEPSIGTWLSSPRPKPRSTSAASASTGWSSTPSTTRSISGPWPRCSRRWPPAARRRWCGSHGTARRTSSECSMPAPGAWSCRWSTPGKRPNRPSPPPATTRTGRAASAVAASRCRSMPALRIFPQRERSDPGRPPDRAYPGGRKRGRDPECAGGRRLLHRSQRSRRFDGLGTRRAAGKRRSAAGGGHHRDS